MRNRAHVKATKEEGSSTTWRIEVDGNRHVNGLSREQYLEVIDAIEYAMSVTESNTKVAIRNALGIEQ